MFNKIVKYALEYYFKSKRELMKKTYNRILPIGDYVSDRWDKAKFYGFGKDSSVYDSCLILGQVVVGNNTWVGPFTILDGSGDLLTIGSNCNISAGAQIYTHDTVAKVTSNGEIRTAETKIGNNCYIGPNVIIQAGVTIGNNAVIGANSFVNKDIPSYSKAYGTPARVMQ